MPRRSALRASDADREHTADRLRHATAEGRLDPEELEQRLGAVFAARTYGDLDALVADLPRRDLARRGRRQPNRLTRVPAPALLVLIPVAMALAVAAVTVLVTVFALWAVIVTIAWLAFGHRRPYYYPARYYRRTMRHAYGRWRA